MNFSIDTQAENLGTLIICTTNSDNKVVFSAPNQYTKAIDHYIAHSNYTSKNTELAFIVSANGQQVILSSTGSQENFKQDKLRKAIGRAIKDAKKQKLTNICIVRQIWSEGLLLLSWPQLVAETCILAAYEYKKYLSEKGEFAGFENIHIQVKERNAEAEEALKKGIVLGNCTTIARDLINETSLDLYPETLAQKVLSYGEIYGFEVQVFEEEACAQMGMNAFLSVGMASSRKPKLIVMRYNGGSNTEAIGLVGKGVTYDTGGLSLKPTGSMLHMKSDMSGSALVIATMCALAQLKSTKNVVAVVAACENSVAGNAYRPGDVLKSMNGKTIEIGNTDAEGRLTLADAITYAIRNEKVHTVIDLATLTGAVKVALGDHVAGAITTSQNLFDKLNEVSKLADENYWQLPIDDEYRDLNNSDIADICNIGKDGLAGSITAACFVEAFTENLPWLHLDIAGVSFFKKEHEYLSKGGSGRGMRSLYHLVESL